MDWIDFTALNTKGILPSSWNYEAVETYLPAQDIARKKDILLITMQSDALADDAVRCVRDHINVSGVNPLRGHNNDVFGVRFPDMSHPYEIPSFCSSGNSILIRAGQHLDYPVDAIEASPIVYQTIIAKHQGKTVIALLYGQHVKAQHILNLFQGEDNA